jgi:glycine dehydrogenase
MIRDFESRHIGPRPEEVTHMLETIGVNSIDELIEQTVPAAIRRKSPMDIGKGLSEFEYLAHIRAVEAKNKVFKTHIGLGYHGTITPSVILRNIFENPGWYTAYTPYQAEIAQGRLEALLNFQTMIMDLTGLDLANASLLDEASAAAESMHMFYALRSKEQVKNNANVLFVADSCFPQTIDLLRTRSAPLGIELRFGNPMDFQFTPDVFGAVIQYPNIEGDIEDYRSFCSNAKANQTLVCVCADLMSLVLLTPPGDWGADCVVGSSQRFGVPMGFGGPHAAFFATRESYKRVIPGRIIGVSIDSQGNQALRMALQTREQHIKRDKATSNICTAQALLAIMASMYAVYHGPAGLRRIALKIHSHTRNLAENLQALGLKIITSKYFDTITVDLNSLCSIEALNKESLEKHVNLRYNKNGTVSISINEINSSSDIKSLVEIFSTVIGKKSELEFSPKTFEFWSEWSRKDVILKEAVFNTYHSETEMMRYIKKLENKDLALNHSMISLGSCTMKLNAATELMPLSLPGFANLHPFIPIDQAQGYYEMFDELSKALCEATGFSAVSLQPNSGAQGEYAGLMAIRAYHLSRGEKQRVVALIPSSAHGTNPASAVMAGMQVVVTACDSQGNVDIADLRAKAELHKDRLSALMVTYPSTHGVFEEGIMEITKIIHDNGGLVYMDGANMNAQVGLTSPGTIGADVCHLNLHKTFAIPHGGGGPGMGPIGVNEKLAPFLPGHSLIKTGGTSAIHAVSATPFGSSLILLVSYAYIKMLGAEGLTNSTKFAILNANYLRKKLENHYPILYRGFGGNVAHEMIIDCREFKRTAGVEVGDIAKRLMDYGYHAPTVSFPVAGTMMIEPTESEGLSELNRFTEAMISIRNEIAEIETGIAQTLNNVIVNAPHTQNVICADSWERPYPRTKAAFPLPWVSENKFWPSVGKVDNAYGDRNLVCSCAPIEAYAQDENPVHSN